MAAGQWMLAHHASWASTRSATPSRIGAGSPTSGAPRSRWRSCPGPSARRPTPSTPSSSARCCLVATAFYARAAGRPRRPGRRHRPVALRGHRRASWSGTGAGLLAGLVPARAPGAGQGPANPRWLFALPSSVVAVGQHARLDPDRPARPRRRAGLVAGARPAGDADRRHRQSPHTGPLGLALLGSVVASCITPYGPGLLTYDVGVAATARSRSTSTEWNSPGLPFAHGAAGLLRSVGRAGRVHPPAAASRCSRASLGGRPLRRGAADPAPGRLPHGGGGRPGGLLSRCAGLGGDGRRWAGAGLVVLAIVILARPSVPAGSRRTVAPGAGLRLSERRTRAGSSPSTRGATTPSPATGPPSSTAAPTSSRGRADRVLRRDQPDDGSRPVLSSYHVSYVVWAPRTALSEYLAHDPRWRVVDRTRGALVFARR